MCGAARKDECAEHQKHPVKRKILSLTNEDNQSDRYYVVRNGYQRIRRYIQPEERSLPEKTVAVRLEALGCKKVAQSFEHSDFPARSQPARTDGYRRSVALVRKLNCIKQIAQRDRLLEVKRAYRCGFCLSLLGTERSNENETFSRTPTTLIL